MSRPTALGALLAPLVAICAVLSPLVVADESAPAPAAQDARAAVQTDAEVSIAWAGDITPGSRYGVPPDGGRAQFAGVREPVRDADLALGNLEGTFSVGGASKCGADAGQCFSFQAPPEHAAALDWAGFDVLNLANNHAFDFGSEGQAQTVAALDGHGLAHTGRPGEIRTIRRAGTRIAVVGFAPYPWANDLRDLAGVGDLVRAAAERSDVVVVLAHAGGEGTDQAHVPFGREIAMGEDRGDTRAFAHTAVEAGADLVLGSGPHVLRGIEVYRGKLIAYSLGNFAGWHNFSTAGALSTSGLLTVRLSRRGHLRGGSLLPLRLDGPGVPTRDDTATAITLVNALGEVDFGGSGLRLLPNGSF